MGEDSTKALSNVIRIGDERIQGHLGKIVRGSVGFALHRGRSCSYKQGQHHSVEAC